MVHRHTNCFLIEENLLKYDFTKHRLILKCIYMIVCVYFYSEMGKIVSTAKKDIPELKA